MRICVPYRTDGGHRERVWAACEQRWRRLIPEADIHLGNPDGEPFSRSAARNAAADGEWTVALFCDADAMVTDRRQVDQAVSMAAATTRMVFAHTWQVMVSEDRTAHILAGDEPRPDDGSRHQNTFSLCYAVPRPLWDAVGGFDERFVGWGFEDLAFMRAASALGGVHRVPGDVFHLWHPRDRALQEEQPHYRANQQLWDRYVQAGNNRVAMRGVLGR